MFKKFRSRDARREARGGEDASLEIPRDVSKRARTTRANSRRSSRAAASRSGAPRGGSGGAAGIAGEPVARRVAARGESRAVLPRRGRSRRRERHNMWRSARYGVRERFAGGGCLMVANRGVAGAAFGPDFECLILNEERLGCREIRGSEIFSDLARRWLRRRARRAKTRRVCQCSLMEWW